MSGTNNWKTIREKRVGNDPARIERARRAFIADLRLANLRKHRNVSQTDVASQLQVSQANVSQLERGDIKYSTLAGYVDALGGHLAMQAVFNDETVAITGLPIRGGPIAFSDEFGGATKVLNAVPDLEGDLDATR